MPRVNVKDKRKQQLMEANMASIARRGLDGTTIAHVSKGAGMSRGIVNFYFTSKEKMMQETLLFLAGECQAAWEAGLEEARRSSDDAHAHIKTLLHVMLGDRLCSARRLAVWAAFLGQAGTKSSYARIIRAMDEAFVKQCRELWQKSGSDAKIATLRARQLHAVIRGHWLLAALGDDKPSQYMAVWTEMLQEPEGSVAPAAKEKPAVKQTVVALKPKKIVPDVLHGQLDMGDLFSR